MVNALWITLIGMGLVFVAILLLWGLMALLVQLTAERVPQAQDLQDASPGFEAGQGAQPETAGETGQVQKRKAAAAAVAVALALQKQRVQSLGMEKHSAGQFGAWQAVHRAGELSRRGMARKNR